MPLYSIQPSLNADSSITNLGSAERCLQSNEQEWFMCLEREGCTVEVDMCPLIDHVDSPQDIDQQCEWSRVWLCARDHILMCVLALYDRDNITHQAYVHIQT